MILSEKSATFRDHAYAALGACGVVVSGVRACRAIAISAEPPNSMLMPTSSPSAQAAVPGSPIRIMPARMRSMMPLASIQPHRPDSSFLCSSAYMIESTPSMMKNTISSSVSDMAPLIGHTSSTMPAAMASTAESSDHQNPGECRAQNVVISPMMPLMRNSQPRNSVNVMVASGGTMIANMPSTTRTIPSIKNK